ncbi:hypothetical protein [Salmonirosea aquatica]|uniref:hypothetical protein n=1 Tax=Salmonirosea aquatica TaxID=2654236 RepID=UPI003570B360
MFTNYLKIAFRNLHNRSWSMQRFSIALDQAIGQKLNAVLEGTPQSFEMAAGFCL